MTDNYVLTAALVVASLAVIGRVLINSQRRGRIDWGKIAVIFAAAAALLLTALYFDPYRAETLLRGSAGRDDLDRGLCLGRKPDSDAPRLAALDNGILFPQFAVLFDEVEATGYHKRKLDPASEPDLVQRQDLVSASDTARTAIRRVTNVFDITRNPRDADDYLPICVATLHCGERVLAVLAPYDAHAGESPVLAARPLAGKMQQIAEKSVPCNQEIYLVGYDSLRLQGRRYTYLAAKLLVGGLAAALVAALGMALRKKKRL